ncbi:MAG: fatty acid desaturase family protein [Rhodospirillales bacterium]
MPTNAASSGVRLDKATLKPLTRRSDRPGLRWLAVWLALLATTGGLLWWSLGSWWSLPATLLFGSCLTLPAYAMSHECAHGTAFRSRWLNETVFWATSLIYGEEPAHRRYAHACHHSNTWHPGKDAQMPFATPMTFRGWVLEVTGLGMIAYEAQLLLRTASGRPNGAVTAVAPASELPRLILGARIFLAVYLGLAMLAGLGQWWVVTFLLLPRLAGGPAMQLYTITQHVELEENAADLRRSTRSIRSGALGRFLYMNMQHHIEHHLFPLVPFHRLPALNRVLAPQLPPPDPGLWPCNLAIATAVVKRSLGRNPRSDTIRQAPLPAAE